MDNEHDSRQETVIDGLYEAAVEPASWPQALRALARWVGADAVMMVEADQGARRVVLEQGHAAGYVAAYQSRWLQHDPRLEQRQTGIGAAPGGVLDAFRDFEGEHGILASFADPLAIDGSGPSWLLLTSRGHDEQTRMAIRYGRLRQHLERALRLTRRHAGMVHDSRALAELTDDLPLGVLLLDDEGRVSHANLLARAVLEAADALEVRDGRMRALRSGDEQRLQAALKAARAAAGDLGTATQWLSLPRRSGEPPYTLALRRAGGDAVVRVVIGDAGRVPRVSTEALSTLFELTTREAQVCARLLRGLSIEETAADLGVSPRTARVYLQQVFLKLGVHRQADLVRLLMGCPALLDFRAWQAADAGGPEARGESDRTGGASPTPARGLRPTSSPSAL